MKKVIAAYGFLWFVLLVGGGLAGRTLRVGDNLPGPSYIPTDHPWNRCFHLLADKFMGPYQFLVYAKAKEPGGLTDPEAVLKAGWTYTLKVEVGNAYWYDWGGYKVQLLAGGTPHTPGDGSDYTGPVTGGTLLAEDDSSLAVPDGTFMTSTVTYSYDPMHAALVGEPLQIRLLALIPTEPTGDEVEVEFDNVRLTAVPEPATLALLSLGALMVRRRRRQ